MVTYVNCRNIEFKMHIEYPRSPLSLVFLCRMEVPRQQSESEVSLSTKSREEKLLRQDYIWIFTNIFIYIYKYINIYIFSHRSR